MSYIYKYTNIENGKTYIGQTNNIQKRKNGHRSCAHNKNSNEYNSPFHRALRKYGEDKFNFEILEEIDDDDIELINEREQFFIAHYQSLVSQNGYNISLGGDGHKMLPKTYKEKLKLSKLFTANELKDIQEMLRQDISFATIIKKYPKMKPSFLSNINIGLAFYNPEWQYPLQKVWKSRFTKSEVAEIKNMIKDPSITYQAIAEKFNIKSQGFISGINSGRYFTEDGETYPLRVSKHGRTMATKAQELLITEDWHNYSTKTEIYKVVAKICGYNQIGSIKKIDLGLTHKKDNLLYPLLNYQKENQLLLK